MEKNVNIKKILIFICMFFSSWIILFLLTCSYNFLNISLIGNKDLYVNVGSNYFENGYRGQYLFSSLNNMIKTKDNINIDKVGKYYIKYSLDLLFTKKETYRTVYVVDKTEPKITLNGDATIYVKKNFEYNELGATASDNVDKDLDNKIKISGYVDTSKMGVYEIVYSVSDSSNNFASQKRTVEVIENNILSAPVKDFTLDGVYEKVKLKAGDKIYSYIDDAVIVGDSNIKYLYLYGRYLNKNQVWGRDNLNASSINNSRVTIYRDNSNKKVIDAVDEYKPKYLIATFGLTSTLYLSKNEFIKNVKSFFDEMEKRKDNTKLIVAATIPIVESMYNQNAINKYNYYLLELCNEYKIPFITPAEQLKNTLGYGDSKYFQCNSVSDCGFHLNNKGKSLYVDYLKRINLEEKII